MSYFPRLIRCALLCGACAAPGTRDKFPEASALKPQGGLPDPLVMFDGRPVLSHEQWFQTRRPELQALFAHYMYGTIPPKPRRFRATVQGQYADFLDGKATLKLLS